MTRAAELRAWYHLLPMDQQESVRARAEAILGIRRRRGRRAAP